MNDISRRELIAGGISAGWALATAPTTAWALTTPADGLDLQTVSIPIGGTTMPAYLAMPKGKQKVGVVLVVQEIFGVHAYIQDVCRRFAKEGYLAVAPYLYSREGDVTKMTDVQKILSDVVAKVPQAQVWADLDATVAFLGTHPRADVSRIGITGFCWGGNVVWTYAAQTPSLKAGVAWYGRVEESMGPAPTKTPLELVPSLKVPVLGLYGGKDTGIPVTGLDKMRAELAKGKTGSEIVVYPEAQHGFHADYRPSYDAKAAKDGWVRTLAWFRTHGLR